MGSNLGRFFQLLLVDDEGAISVVVDDVPLRQEQLQRNGVHVRGHRGGVRPRRGLAIGIRVVTLHCTRFQFIFNRQSFLKKKEKKSINYKIITLHTKSTGGDGDVLLRQQSC